MSVGLDGIVQHNERETVKTRPESGLLLLHPQQLEKCSILIISRMFRINAQVTFAEKSQKKINKKHNYT